MNQTKEDDKRTIICCVAFVFIFILLIFAIIWTNLHTFECFTDIVNSNHDTFINKIKGGKYYHALNNNDDINQLLQKNQNQTAFIALLADWCGYCKQFKQSNVLTELSKNIPVFVMNHNHPQTKEIMQLLESNAFPTLAIYKNGQLTSYNGNRSYHDILTAFQS